MDNQQEETNYATYTNPNGVVSILSKDALMEAMYNDKKKHGRHGAYVLIEDVLYTYTDAYDDKHSGLTLAEAKAMQEDDRSYDMEGTYKAEPTDDAPAPSVEVITKDVVDSLRTAGGTVSNINRWMVDGLRTVRPGTVSNIASQRIMDDDTQLAKLGLVRPMHSTSSGELHTAGGYKAGTVTIGMATEKLATGRREWEDQPYAEESMGIIQDAVRSEQREDIVVPSIDLHFQDDGALWTPNGVIGMEASGLKSFMAGTHTMSGPAFPNAFTFLMSLPLEERISIMNTVLSRSKDSIKLRTRVNDDGERGVFATVSPKYASFDADLVMERMGNAVAGLGYRGEATYNAATTSVQFDATYHAPPTIQDFAAGDVFKVGLRGKTNDAGKGSVKFGPVAFWNACLNMIIISNEDACVRIVHKGSMERMDTLFNKQVRLAQPVMEEFAKRWGILAETPMLGIPLWGETYTNVKDVFEVVAERLGKAAGKAVKVEHLLTAYDAQSEKDTLQAVVNAATRMAHSADAAGVKLLSDIQRDAMERASGELVKVLAVQATKPSAVRV